MKILTITLALLFTLQNPEPCKRCDTIIIKEAEKDFNDTIVLLFDEGFSIEFKDKDSGILQTKVASIQNFYISVSLRFERDKVTVYANGGIEPDDLSRVRNVGMKGSPNKKQFQKLNEIAKKIGGKISYSKTL